MKSCALSVSPQSQLMATFQLLKSDLHNASQTDFSNTLKNNVM